MSCAQLPQLLIELVISLCAMAIQNCERTTVMNMQEFYCDAECVNKDCELDVSREGQEILHLPTGS